MIDFDLFREIFTTIKQNKLRTFLTGFSVAWGIFMLILLLGSGNGLKNGVESQFAYMAKNSVTIYPGSTSIPYKGLSLDRPVKLNEQDLNMIRTQMSEVEYLTGRINLQTTVSYDKEYGSWAMQGVGPDAVYINNINTITKGRFVNEIDSKNQRKVIVINTEMEDILFKGIDPLGKYVNVSGIAFMVIGVYEDQMGRSDTPSYIPFTTARSLYRNNFGMDVVDFTVKNLITLEANEEFGKRLRQKMGELHRFDAQDMSALYIYNRAEQSVQTNLIFTTITLFIWVIGVFSLIAGIVGIGNIMLITVKERTREFGIRKAIGASPLSILKMVLLESIIITSLFGVVGMFLGVSTTEIGAYILDLMSQVKDSSESRTIFMNPTVDIRVVLEAVFVLIIAGVIAGAIPAIKAVRIRPIEAMRAE